MYYVRNNKHWGDMKWPDVKHIPKCINPLIPQRLDLMPVIINE